MIVGQHDEKTLEQFADVASRAARTALMADGHLGYIMPVGGVAAYQDKVSIAGVGFDIACGNAAIRTNLKAEHLLSHRSEFADTIASVISFGVGRTNKADDAPTDDPLFDDPAWDAIPSRHRGNLREKARSQLGTVGSGNHYVDVFADENGDVWVGVHFGSRGFGHTVASGFMAIARGDRWGDRGKEVEGLVSVESGTGHDYWHLMELAGRYAYVGREWVARKVVELLGGTEVELVHNHHNFAWRETHFGTEYIVVRKGATPAFPGQLGFVGGSMGDEAVILRGTVDDSVREYQEALLFSTVHGAGRVMSRTEAAGKRKMRKRWECGQRNCDGWLPWETKRNEDGSNPRCPVCATRMHKRSRWETVREGKVTPDMMDAWITHYDVTLRGGGLDESPHAYRRLPDVLAAQGPTVEVLHTLRPLIVVMAGANEFDPYKD